MLEIIVVITILAIMATFAVPTYLNSMSHYRVHSAAARIKSDLELARRRAQTASAGRQVVFDTNHDLYVLANVVDPRSAPHTTVALANSPYQVDLHTVNFGGHASLVFDGFGTPNTSGSLNVRSGNNTKRVIVDATGLVRIE